jgi:2-succinyl-6-hydroxy-2,4-cyclohexadiene-1-carboxylate synthase
MAMDKFLTHTDSAAGQKPAVLFLHGFLGCKEDWDEVATGLRFSYRTVQIDLPGHGGSLDFNEDAYSMPGCARLILALLNQLGITRSHLVGYSMGGRLALYMAVNFPDRFNRVVIESGSAGLATPELREGRRAHDEQVAATLETGPIAEFLDGWYKQPLFHTVKRNPDRFQQMMSRRVKNTGAELARVLRGMGTGSQPYLVPQLESLPHEILFAAGALDEKFAVLALELSDQAPNATALVLPEAGHTLHFEQPKAYIEAVGSFLTEGI